MIIKERNQYEILEKKRTKLDTRPLNLNTGVVLHREPLGSYGAGKSPFLIIGKQHNFQKIWIFSTC
jgi:hypothetical protein